MAIDDTRLGVHVGGDSSDLQRALREAGVGTGRLKTQVAEMRREFFTASSVTKEFTRTQEKAGRATEVARAEADSLSKGIRDLTKDIELAERGLSREEKQLHGTALAMREKGAETSRARREELEFALATNRAQEAIAKEQKELAVAGAALERYKATTKALTSDQYRFDIATRRTAEAMRDEAKGALMAAVGLNKKGDAADGAARSQKLLTTEARNAAEALLKEATAAEIAAHGLDRKATNSRQAARAQVETSVAARAAAAAFEHEERQLNKLALAQQRAAMVQSVPGSGVVGGLWRKQNEERRRGIELGRIEERDRDRQRRKEKEDIGLLEQAGHVIALRALTRPLRTIGIFLGSQSIAPLAASVVDLAGGFNILASSLAPLAGGMLVGVAQGLAGIGLAAITARLALKNVGKAIFATGTAQETAFRKLQKPARDFVLLIRKDYLPAFRETQQLAQKGLFPGLLEGAAKAKTALGPIQKLIYNMGLALGDVAKNAGGALGNKTTQNLLLDIGDGIVRQTKALGRGGILGIEGVLNVLSAGQPMLNAFAREIERIGRSFRNWAAAAKQDGTLASFFARVREDAARWEKILSNVGRILMGFLGAGLGASNRFLDGFVKLTGKWADWVNSVKGQNSIAKFLEVAGKGLNQLGLIVADITTALLGLGAVGNTQLGTVRNVIRDSLLPTIVSLGEAFTALLPNTAKVLKAVTRFFRALLATVVELNPVLKVLADTLALVLNAAAKVVEVTPGAFKIVPAFLVTATILASWNKLRTIIKSTLELMKAEGALSAVSMMGGRGGAASAAKKAEGAAVSASPFLFTSSAAKSAEKKSLGAFLKSPELLAVAKKAGLVGLGLSAVSGLTAAFGDKSKQASFGGRVRNFVAGALGLHATDYKKKANQIRDDILRGIDPNAKARDQSKSFINKALDRIPSMGKGGTDVESGLSASAKRGLANARKLMAEAQRLLGRGIRLNVHLNDKGLRNGLRTVQASFAALRSGAAITMKDVERYSKTGFDALAQIIDTNTNAGAKAAGKNMRAVLHAIRLNMDLSNVSAHDAMVSIKRIMKQQSGLGAAALGTNLNLAVGFIKSHMRDAKGITAEGMAYIAKLFYQEAKAFNLSDKTAAANARRKAYDIAHHTDRQHGDARGGLHQFGKPGDSGQDSIPVQIGRENIVVAPGEVAAVFTRHQLPEVQKRFADQGGLGGFMRSNNRPHYMAQGGLIGAARGAAIPGLHSGINNLALAVLDKFPGLQYPTHGQTTGGNHVKGSDHYAGLAVDLSDGTGGSELMNQAAAWVRSNYGKGLKQGIHNPNLSINRGATVPPGFWGSFWATHRDHLHLAVAGGALAKGGLGGAGGGAAAVWKKIAQQTVTPNTPGTLGGLSQWAIDINTEAANALGAKMAKEQGASDSGAGPGDVHGPGAGNVGGIGRAAMRKLLAKWHLPNIFGWIAGAETGWNPSDHNPSGATGLFQIMMPLHAATMAAHGIRNLYDADQNTHGAAILSSGGSDLSPWDASRNEGGLGGNGGWGQMMGRKFAQGGLVDPIMAAMGFASSKLVDPPSTGGQGDTSYGPKPKKTKKKKKKRVLTPAERRRAGAKPKRNKSKKHTKRKRHLSRQFKKLRKQFKRFDPDNVSALVNDQAIPKMLAQLTDLDFDLTNMQGDHELTDEESVVNDVVNWNGMQDPQNTRRWIGGIFQHVGELDEEIGLNTTIGNKLGAIGGARKTRLSKVTGAISRREKFLKSIRALWKIQHDRYKHLRKAAKGKQNWKERIAANDADAVRLRKYLNNISDLPGTDPEVKAQKQKARGDLLDITSENKALRKSKPKVVGNTKLNNRLSDLGYELKIMAGSATKFDTSDDKTWAGQVTSQLADLTPVKADETSELQQLSKGDLPQRSRDILALRKERDEWLGTTSTSSAASDAQSALTALLSQQNQDLARALAVSQAQYAVFKGFAPLVGRFAHGGVVPQTGLAIVERGETITTDPEGPFRNSISSNNTGGGGVGRLDLYLGGDLGPMVKVAEAVVDKRAVPVVRKELGRNAGRLARTRG